MNSKVFIFHPHLPQKGQVPYAGSEGRGYGPLYWTIWGPGKFPRGGPRKTLYIGQHISWGTHPANLGVVIPQRMAPWTPGRRVEAQTGTASAPQADLPPQAVPQLYWEGALLMASLS